MADERVSREVDEKIAQIEKSGSRHWVNQTRYVGLEANDFEWLIRELRETREKLKIANHDTQNLLAVIHRDGGHHTAGVGIHQSCEDAQAVVVSERAAAEEHEGHGQPCYYCHKPTNDLSANPGQWSIGLCHPDEPGVLKWHHGECVSKCLAAAEEHAKDRERLLGLIEQFAARIREQTYI